LVLDSLLTHLAHQVYNVTDFLKDHPAGKKAHLIHASLLIVKPLLKVAGQDASKQFDAFHNAAIMEKYGPQLYVGDIGEAPKEQPESTVEGGEEEALFGDLVPYGDPYWYMDFNSVRLFVSIFILMA
jgi:cytochrome b involved in lipid metabolism